jgi:hypothetical protein
MPPDQAMRERITNRHIEFELSCLNEMMGTPKETVREIEPEPGSHARFRYNVGNIHLYDTNVVQTKNEAGGIAVLARCNTKREAHSHIQAMTETVRQFRMNRGI